MAVEQSNADEKGRRSSTCPSSPMEALVTSYLGIGFAAFLSLLPQNALTYVSSLQARNRVLAMRLFEAEDQLKQMRARRRDDARANARAAEILAGHRNTWLEAERNLLARLHESQERVLSLEKALAERDDKLETDREDEVEEERQREDENSDCGNNGSDVGEEEELREIMYQQGLLQSSFDNNWFDGSNLDHHTFRQGMKQYDSIEPIYSMKHMIPRRETPWKIDMESSGVPSKLKELEEDLGNLENVGKGDLCKVLTLMRKQSKRYQSLSSKIEDICKRMQVSDPYDASIGPEFRTQRQTEFLMEAFRLQQRATEARHKLGTIQSETLNANFGEELTTEEKLNMKRCLDSIRNNLKEIQRNLEVWLARILGDLEGMLARDGTSRMREYYLSPHTTVR